MTDSLSEVTINLEEMPAAGDKQIITRVRPEDKADIDKACRRLGLLLSDFQRIAIINAARKVNAVPAEEPADG